MSDQKSAVRNQQFLLPPRGQLMFRLGQTHHDDDTMKGTSRFRPIGDIHPDTSALKLLGVVPKQKGKT